MTTAVVLDVNTFFRRLQRLRNHWKVPTAFGELAKCDVLMLALGNPSDLSIYQKTTAMFTWLLGYEFPETVMLITRNNVTFITTVRKGAILDAVSLKDSSVKVLKREKEIGKAEGILQEAWSCIQTSRSSTSSPVKLATLSKDKNEGPMIQEWLDFVKGQSCEFIDVAPDIGDLLATKDQAEESLERIAAKATSTVFCNHLAKKVLTCVDEGRKTSHSALADDIESFVMNHMSRVKGELPSGVNIEFLDICYPPIIQSGGSYSLKPSAVSNDEAISCGKGFILCSMGLRYRSYCANMARTFIIDGNVEQESFIAFAYNLRGHLASKLIPGVALNQVHAEGVSYVRERRPDLEKHLAANFGFGIGLEFRAPEYIINAKCERKLMEGMVFNLFVGLQDLPGQGAVMLADTVLVTETGATFLTNGLDDGKEVSFAISSGTARSSVRRVSAADVAGSTISSSIKTRLRSQTTHRDESTEKRRREHQRELGKQRIQEALEKYGSGEKGAAGEKKSEILKFESYRKEALMPKELGAGGSLRIFVDKRAETVILPINGMAVPFHIHTIKNVTKSEEGDYAYLRINLNSPGRSVAKKDNPQIFEDVTANYLRGITLRTADTYRAQEVFKDIQELKKNVAEREAARKEKADLVEQGALQEVAGRRPVRLSDVYVRPGPEGRRLPGDVEIHTNGIRWRSQLKGDQRVDVLFSNIKHLIFQPCDHETIVLVHLHLHHPIMVGKKKTKDIQLYREALDSLIDETSGRRTKLRYGDEDEIAQEREERHRRAEANNEFKSFAENISEASRNTLEVDVPFRDLGFTGVPGRQNVLVQPTTDCLVHLVELPFLVVTLSEVEVAFLERVVFGLKNFDLVFVFKDHSLSPVHITSIPMTQLEAVKEWLDSVDVYYVESKVNFNWTNIMKTVNEDPTGFYEMGGWTYLQPDEAGAADESEDGSSEYEPDEDDEEEEDEESEEEYEESEEEEEEESEEYSDESEESEDAPDWDELEEETRREDERTSSKKRSAPAPAASRRPAPLTKRR